MAILTLGQLGMYLKDNTLHLVMVKEVDQYNKPEHHQYKVLTREGDTERIDCKDVQYCTKKGRKIFRGDYATNYYFGELDEKYLKKEEKRMVDYLNQIYDELNTSSIKVETKE